MIRVMVIRCNDPGFGRRVAGVGGTHRQRTIRGRDVFLPDTPESRALIHELCEERKVIGITWPDGSWVSGYRERSVL